MWYVGYFVSIKCFDIRRLNTFLMINDVQEDKIFYRKYASPLGRTFFLPKPDPQV